VNEICFVIEILISIYSLFFIYYFMFISKGIPQMDVKKVVYFQGKLLFKHGRSILGQKQSRADMHNAQYNNAQCLQNTNLYIVNQISFINYLLKMSIDVLKLFHLDVKEYCTILHKKVEFIN